MIKPTYSFSFLLSINIFVWQNVLKFLDARRIILKYPPCAVKQCCLSHVRILKAILPQRKSTKDTCLYEFSSLFWTIEHVCKIWPPVSETPCMLLKSHFRKEHAYNAATRILVSCLSHESRTRMNKIQCSFNQTCC